MNDDDTSTPRRRSYGGLILLLLALGLLGFGAWRGWVWWQVRDAQAQAEAEAVQRIGALEARMEALRRDQRAQTQRIQDAAATNRVLRDEVLGLSQRGALLEESIAKLTDPNRHGPQALRLDEAEFLLSQASQRLNIAGDLKGARHAYELAAGALDGVDDHRLLNLKQVLAQERAAIDELSALPKTALSMDLDRLAAALTKLPREATSPDTQHRPAWQRLLAPLVDVRPSQAGAIVAPSDRTAGEAALQIEISLARAALEHNDAEGFRTALNRVDTWLPRLWPESPPLRQIRLQLEKIRTAPLQPDLPVLGSTLEQLRAARNATPLTFPSTPSISVNAGPELQP
ncbi:uroporphyrinogen-III C-methyltransferase [Pseudoxanthomonas sp. UTMC 1351]|uniref:uroporphyrinogen-III C-methyltransferase n=1 Tax=Pseudoxanthomonas sp. UTMC 1351 TaxID=2695853 RepID=UPI0034CDC9EA